MMSAGGVVPPCFKKSFVQFYFIVSAVACKSKKDVLWPSYLQETTGVIFLDDFQTVLHQACGLTQLYRTVGDLIPHHLEKQGEQKRKHV